MKTAPTDLIRRFDADCAEAFRFLDKLHFRRGPIEADTRTGTVRYSKRGAGVQITYDVLDHDVVAHVVRRRGLRRQVIRVGCVEVAGNADLEEAVSEAVSTLASAVRRELGRVR